MANACTHLDQINVSVERQSEGCAKCVEMGDTWVHLRMCLICGHVGCCDSSKNKHATAHFHEADHPLMQSAEPGQSWRYCYVDKAMV